MFKIKHKSFEKDFDYYKNSTFFYKYRQPVIQHEVVNFQGE
jgi:hypothetical protein